MLIFWTMTFITVILLHYQYHFAKSGKTKNIVALTFFYSILTFTIHSTEYQLTFLAMMYVVIALWLMVFVSLYKSF